MIKYRKRKSNISLYITIFLLLMLILFSHKNPERSKMPSNLINTVVSPINQVFYSISQNLRDLYEKNFGDKSKASKIQALELENAKLKEDLRKLELVVGKEKFLKNEFELMKKTTSNYVRAQVTGKDPLSIFIRFTIDVGEKDGVRVGDIVVEAVKDKDQESVSGLVGRVVETGYNYSKVSSIMDQINNFSVMFKNSMSYGIIDGRDDESFFGYMLDSEKGVSIGEEIYTSGMGGIYPRGLYVGEIVDVQKGADDLVKTFSVESPVDFNSLYRVFVIKNSQEEFKEAKDE